MSNQEIYEQKVQRILDTVNHKPTEQVPTMAMFGTWAVHYSGYNIKDIEEKPEREIEAFTKPFERLYTDVSYTCGIGFDPMSSRLLGAGGRFISDDGKTIQHKEICPMTVEDYDACIADPIAYMANEIIPRKADRLQGSTEECYEAIKEFIAYQGNKKRVQGILSNKLKDDYATPILVKTSVKPAMDIIFDCLRGFKGISADMRRNPDKLLDLINALEPFANDVLGIPDDATSLPSFPFYGTMMHIPTFINPKQFEKFFWPSYFKTMQRINSLGGKIIFFLEGTWKNKFDYLNELPDNYSMGIIEADDIFDAKKCIGKKVAICGGMPHEMIKHGTADQCKEYAKKLIDNLAVDGGYMLTSSIEYICDADIDFDNLCELYDFVRDYRG